MINLLPSHCGRLERLPGGGRGQIRSPRGAEARGPPACPPQHPRPPALGLCLEPWGRWHPPKPGPRWGLGRGEGGHPDAPVSDSSEISKGSLGWGWENVDGNRRLLGKRINNNYWIWGREEGRVSDHRNTRIPPLSPPRIAGAAPGLLKGGLLASSHHPGAAGRPPPLVLGEQEFQECHLINLLKAELCSQISPTPSFLQCLECLPHSLVNRSSWILTPPGAGGQSGVRCDQDPPSRSQPPGEGGRPGPRFSAPSDPKAPWELKSFEQFLYHPEIKFTENTFRSLT